MSSYPEITLYAARGSLDDVVYQRITALDISQNFAAHEPIGTDTGAFTVTHKLTGFAIPAKTSSLENAKAMADEFEEVGDWGQLADIAQAAVFIREHRDALQAIQAKYGKVALS